MSREERFPLSAPLVSLVGFHVDSLDFARDGRVLAADVALVDMERLQEVLVDRSGSIAVKLTGEQDAERISWLILELDGELSVCCQRCLGILHYPLSIRSRLRLMRSGEEWPEDDLEDGEADMIEAQRELQVLSLVEDEILLALPLAPMHEECALPGADDLKHKPSPFAALEILKKH